MNIAYVWITECSRDMTTGTMKLDASVPFQKELLDCILATEKVSDVDWGYTDITELVNKYDGFDDDGIQSKMWAIPAVDMPGEIDRVVTFYTDDT